MNIGRSRVEFRGEKTEFLLLKLSNIKDDFCNVKKIRENGFRNPPKILYGFQDGGGGRPNPTVWYNPNLYFQWN